MTEYAQNERITLRAVFTTQEGEAAEVVGTPTISIWHYYSKTKTLDVTSADMTHITGSEYVYDWHIPASADKAVYFVTYNATYSDGTNVIGGEAFHVIPRKFYSKIGGGFTQKIISGFDKEEKKKLFLFLEMIAEKINKIEGIEKINKAEMLKEINKLSNEVDNLDFSSDINNLKLGLEDLSKSFVKSLSTKKLERLMEK